jgi:hypothetical protein
MKKIIVILLILQNVALFSQNIPTGNNQSQDDKYFLESDTLHLKATIIEQNQYGSTDSLGIDTVQRHIELYEDYEKDDLPYINLGQTGTPSLPMVFMLRENYETFMFLNPYIKYLKPIDDFIYYKTNAPYTKFKYMGGVKLKEEQFLDFVHTQTPSRFKNWGIRYKMLTPTDLADPGKTSGINFLSTWYHQQIKAYNIYFAISSFKIRRLENGGIVDTTENFKDNIIYYINNQVRNYIKYNTIFFKQSYQLNYKYQIGHTLKYSTIKKIFVEKTPNLSYFGPSHITNALSYDSTGLRSFDNTLFFNWHTIGDITFSYTNSLKRYYYFRGFLYNLKGEFDADNYFNISLHNCLINRFYFKAKTQLHFTDRNAGNIIISSTERFYIDKKFQDYFQIKTLIKNTSPNYFYDNYNGNYKYWQNNFYNQQKISLNAELNIKTMHLKFGGNIEQLKNYIYFDYRALPRQDSDRFIVSTAYIRKSFRFRPFVLDLNFYYQYTNADSILHLPQYVASSSLYMDFGVAKDALHINMGANIYYYSQFLTYAYEPSIGMFYLDNKRASGGLPIVNLFITGKIKSAILIFRMDNVIGWLLYPYQETVEHYHYQDFFFRMGVQWWFKN